MQQGKRHAANKLCFTGEITLPDDRVGRERQHATAAHAGHDPGGMRRAVERDNPVLLQHDEPGLMVWHRPAREKRLEGEVRQVYADPELHIGSTGKVKVREERKRVRRAAVRGA